MYFFNNKCILFRTYILCRTNLGSGVLESGGDILTCDEKCGIRCKKVENHKMHFFPFISVYLFISDKITLH